MNEIHWFLVLGGFILSSDCQCMCAQVHTCTHAPDCSEILTLSPQAVQLETSLFFQPTALTYPCRCFLPAEFTNEEKTVLLVRQTLCSATLCGGINYSSPLSPQTLPHPLPQKGRTDVVGRQDHGKYWVDFSPQESHFVHWQCAYP